MVFHYDTNPDNFCQSAALTRALAVRCLCCPLLGLISSLELCCMQAGKGGVKDMVVLVSPSNYFKRKAFYTESKTPHCAVLPLLFTFTSLSPRELKMVRWFRIAGSFSSEIGRAHV